MARWRLSLSYLEHKKRTDRLYVDVLIEPVKTRAKASSGLQRRLDGIIDRALLRHEAYREEARQWHRKAAGTRSASWRTRYLREADRLERAGITTERRAAKEVRALEREYSFRYGAQEPTAEDIRQAYLYALQTGKQPAGFNVTLVEWWHNRGRGVTGEREGGVEDLQTMFPMLSDRKATLTIGREDDEDDAPERDDDDDYGEDDSDDD